jgi:hypothetical protein
VDTISKCFQKIRKKDSLKKQAEEARQNQMEVMVSSNMRPSTLGIAKCGRSKNLHSLTKNSCWKQQLDQLCL